VVHPEKLQSYTVANFQNRIKKGCSYCIFTLALGFFNHPLLFAERKGRRGSLFDSAKGPLPKGFFMGPEFGLQLLLSIV
jgi:hypothetical protein